MSNAYVLEDCKRREELLHSIRAQQESIRAQLGKTDTDSMDLDVQLKLEEELDELVKNEDRVLAMVEVCSFGYPRTSLSTFASAPRLAFRRLDTWCYICVEISYHFVQIIVDFNTISTPTSSPARSRRAERCEKTHAASPPGWNTVREHGLDVHP